jgi:hypothetical protein
MRDYKEIANSVFQRREAYLEEKKRKKAVIFRNAAVTLSCCLMIILGFGIWNMDLLKDIKPSQNKEPDNITPVTTTSVTTAVDYTTVSTALTTDISNTLLTETTAPSVSGMTDSTRTVTTASETKHSGNAAVTTTAANGSKNDNKPVRTTSSGMEIIVTDGRSEQSGHSSRTTSLHSSTVTRPRTTTTTRLSPVRTTTLSHVSTTRSTSYTRPRTTTTLRTTVTRTSTTRPHITSTFYVPVFTTTTTAPMTTRLYTSATYATSTHMWYTSATTAPSAVATSATSISTTASPVATTSIDASPINTEPCHEFNYNGSTYTLAEAKYPLEITEYDELLYDGTVYSEYDDRTMNAQIYVYDSYDPAFICMIRFTDTDQVYLGVNYDFVPKDIAEFLTATDFRDNVLITFSIDCMNGVFKDDFDKNEFLNILNMNADTAAEVYYDDPKPIGLLPFKFENIVTIYGTEIEGTIYLIDDGRLEVHFQNRYIFFDIGEDNVYRIYNNLIT